MAYIGKNGYLRFKDIHVQQVGFSKSQKWVIGIDSENQTTFFLLKCSAENYDIGKKIINANGRWFLDISTVLRELKIDYETYCKVENFENNSFSGIKLTPVKKKREIY